MVQRVVRCSNCGLASNQHKVIGNIKTCENCKTILSTGYNKQPKLDNETYYHKDKKIELFVVSTGLFGHKRWGYSADITTDRQPRKKEEALSQAIKHIDRLEELGG